MHCIFSFTFRNIDQLIDCFDDFRDSCNFNQKEKFEPYENMGEFICSNPDSKWCKLCTCLHKPEKNN